MPWWNLALTWSRRRLELERHHVIIVCAWLHFYSVVCRPLVKFAVPYNSAQIILLYRNLIFCWLGHGDHQRWSYGSCRGTSFGGAGTFIYCVAHLLMWIRYFDFSTELYSHIQTSSKTTPSLSNYYRRLMQRKLLTLPPRIRGRLPTFSSRSWGVPFVSNWTRALNIVASWRAWMVTWILQWNKRKNTWTTNSRPSMGIALSGETMVRDEP
jgi:hypothetical protein